jgi:hypothetical protein
MITFAFMELKSPYGSVGCRFGECTNTMILLSFITQEEGQKGANKTCFFLFLRVLVNRSYEARIAIAMVDGSSRCRPLYHISMMGDGFFFFLLLHIRSDRYLYTAR